MEKRFFKHLFMLCLFGTISIITRAADISNNEIWYEASSKLTEITDYNDSGLHTNAFNTTIKSHTFSNGKGIITFNAKVTSIGGGAFSNCSGLTSVTIPNSVTSIGENAFCYCRCLTSMTIPNSVTSIGYSAFYDCPSLTSVTIPNSVTSIEYNAFCGCSGLTSVTIPNSVTSIGENAFCGCSGLTSVTIPNSVTKIGHYAFSGCSSLTKVNITDLDKWVEIEFGNGSANPLCYAKYLYLNGQLVTEAKLTTAKKIGSYAFQGCSSLTSVTIGNSVTSIGDYAFSRCSGLTSVTIPNSVTSIGRSTFSGCSGLTNVTIPNSVTSIGDDAFSDCSSITSLTIPNSVTSIGYLAFGYCSGLTSVAIPSSVTSIGNEAFYACSSLINVYVEWKDADKIPNLDSSDTFPYSTCDLYVPAGTKAIYQGKTFWRNFKNIIDETVACTSVSLNEENKTLSVGETLTLTATVLPEDATDKSVTWSSDNEGVATVVDGVVTAVAAGTANITATTNDGSKLSANCTVNVTATVYSGSCGDNARWTLDTETGLLSITGSGKMMDYDDENELYAPWHNYLNSIKLAHIGNQITSIGDQAFFSCSGMTSVTIPYSVTSIGMEAFQYSGLTSVTIPNSVTSIGSGVFEGCSGLTSVTIGNSVTSIGRSAFYNCKGLTSVTIGNSVTSIGYYAFMDCSSLTSVTIPNSVTSIGNYAFYGCTSLTSITIKAITPPSIYGSNMLYDFTTSILYVPTMALEAYKGHSEWGKFKNIQAIEIPNDEIWYTSSNGKVVTPYNKTDVFGATITSNTYHNGKGIIKFSGNVTSIGYEAFRYSSLTSIDIPNSVTSIGSSAFNYCKYLKNMTIGNSVTSIGDNAFDDCSSLTSVEIPNSVKEIGGYAFRGCSRLTSVYITDLDKWAEIEFESSGANPLYYTHNLYLNGQLVTEAKLETANKVSDFAFYSCSGLTSVTIPNSVTSIGGYAFYGCSGLTSVTIPNSVTSIGERAFYKCSGLTSVTIGNSVTSIGEEAFQNCSDLKNVYVGWKYAKEIPSINGATFSYYRNLYVPYGTKSMYEGNSSWKLFGRIIEPSEQIVKISAAKYGTFGSRYAAKIPDGVSAYTANVDGSTVTMTKIKTGVIPGDCGVILYAESGDYRFAPNAEVDQIEGNQLVSVTDRTYTCTGEDVGKVYYLGLDNESKATFVRLNENGTIPVGKAYLKIDEPIEADAKLDVVFEDTPTGIKTIDNSQCIIDNSKTYNLNGLRVNNSYKGIIIVNAKKYINK